VTPRAWCGSGSVWPDSRRLRASLPPVKRRAWLSSVGGLCVGAAGAWLPRPGLAGAQVEEPLADSVRLVLAAAVASQGPPRPAFADARGRAAYLRWRQQADARLTRHKPEAQARADLLDAVWYESARAGLETALVLGVIQVESGFRKYAISPVGARGYMQVMPFWARLIGDGDERRLFHLQTNLRFGCVILRHYLDMERGDLGMALGRYNGSRGRMAYPQAVLASRTGWASLQGPAGG